MFSLLRIFIVVGIIFYLSPVRQGGDPISTLTSLFGQTAEKPEIASSSGQESSTKLETMWQALPDSAKQAIIGEIVTRSGIVAQTAKPPLDHDNAGSNRSKVMDVADSGRSERNNDAKPAPATARPSDTLRADDRKPAWRGDIRKPHT